MAVQESADGDIAAGTSREMILVHPDAFAIYSGSMFSNSPTTGDWEAYISQDLAAYIDGHYAHWPTAIAAGFRGIRWAATAPCGPE